MPCIKGQQLLISASKRPSSHHDHLNRTSP
jgi:hypothetical protein